MWENILKILQRYGYVYLEGLAGTLWIAALTVVAGTVIGIILAVLRLGKCRPCEWLVRFYIWIIRGTPSLLQLYFFYLFLPKVLPIEISETQSVIIALIISAGAYVSEIIRAGIQAVDPGQTEAASCLGALPGPDPAVHHTPPGGEEYPPGAGQRVCQHDQAGVPGLHLLCE